MKKQLPKLTSDAEAEAFVGEADLTQFDLSEMSKVGFRVHPSPRGETRPTKRSAVGRRVGWGGTFCNAEATASFAPHPDFAYCEVGPPHEGDV